MSTKKNGCGQAAGGCLILFAIAFILFAYVGSQYAPNPSNQPAVTVAPSIESTPLAANVLPGLQPVDVYLNLTNKGFTKEGPKQVGDQLYWKISETTAAHSYFVEIYGPTASTVSLVQANALNFSDADTNTVAQDFFGYIATIPYDGATPANAKKWAHSNIGRNSKATFGNVAFEIFADNSPRARMLTIGTK